MLNQLLMIHSKLCLKIVFSGLFFFGFGYFSIHAQEQAMGGFEQMGAHVHGQALLLLAIENKQLMVELETPAMNVLGYEHRPNNAEQKQQFKRALKYLDNVDNILRIKGTKCRQISNNMKTPIFAESHQDEAKHADEEHQHAEQITQDRDTDSHMDFHLSYVLTCDIPNNLKEIEVILFEQFPGFDMINAQWILPSGQGAGNLDSKQRVIKVN